MNLREWINDHVPEEKMYFYKAFFRQVIFMRDELRYLTGVSPEVVSTHRSKSIQLPVVRYGLDHCVVYARENFHGWVVSVEAEEPVWLNDFRSLPSGLDSQHNQVAILSYAEGFRSEWFYPPYYDGSTEFTVRMNSDYDMYMFMAILKAVTDESA